MKIVIIKTEGYSSHEIKEKHIQQIKDVGSNLEVVSVLQSEASEHLVSAEIVAGVPSVLPRSLENMPTLRWMQSFSAGMDKVLTPEIKESDIIVGNSSGIHAVPISEHILAFLLIFTKRFYRSFANQQQKVWIRDPSLTELRDKTVCIVGLGHIGLQAAKLVSGVGAKIIAIDRPGKQKPDFVDELYSTEQWKQGLSQADFVVSCLPDTPATHHIFNMEKFRMMKETAVFMNIGRGGLVNEEELIEALKENVIAGAALDVTETEPLPEGSPLWEMDNVVITPHQSGQSEKYMDRAIDLFCENLKAYLKGEQIPNLVDKEKGY